MKCPHCNKEVFKPRSKLWQKIDEYHAEYERTHCKKCDHELETLPQPYPMVLWCRHCGDLQRD